MNFHIHHASRRVVFHQHHGLRISRCLDLMSILKLMYYCLPFAFSASAMLAPCYSLLTMASCFHKAFELEGPLETIFYQLSVYLTFSPPLGLPPMSPSWEVSLTSSLNHNPLSSPISLFLHSMHGHTDFLFILFVFPLESKFTKARIFWSLLLNAFLQSGFPWGQSMYYMNELMEQISDGSELLHIFLCKISL